MLINHYTVNTGHLRQSSSNEVDKDMYFTLRRMIDEAMTHEYVDVLDGTKMKLTIEEGCYVLTLFIEKNNELVPILNCTGCKNSKAMAYAWKNAEDLYERVYNKSVKMVPSAPFIADIILPSSVLVPDVFHWTGDFSRCMGWALLLPEEIR